MTPLRAVLLAFVVFITGLLAGIYLQHRWPIGRWGMDARPAPLPALLTPQAFFAIPRERRLVIVIAGQSNAANYGSVRADAGPGVYAWDDNLLFQARDPLPGSDHDQGSIWTRLGPSLLLTGKVDAVLFASIAEGASHAVDWAPNGRLHARLQTTLSQLSSHGISPDFILWQQGESEGGSSHATGADYIQSMRELIGSTSKTAPGARWLIAYATHTANGVGNAQIREAQRLAAFIPGAAPGPDLDTLTTAYRSDGVHFNGPGLDAAAALWAQALLPHLTKRSSP